MKLSEAIRLNSVMKPQGKGNDSIVSRDAPCALGGALQSIGRQPDDFRQAYRELIDHWPWLADLSICPCGQSHHHCSVPAMTIASIIWSLNDLHGWSRSQIADWVEGFEVNGRNTTAGGWAHEEPVVSVVRR